MKRIFPRYIGLLALLIGTLAKASDVSFHQESESYNVYLGVVPAVLLKRTPSLVDHDKQLHGGAEHQSSTAQHVMVTVFRSSDNSRVTNATVIAEVEQSGFFGGIDSAKPLEKMVTSGKIAYGNFFDMPKSGEYEIEIKIYEPQKRGNEEVSFVYKRF